MHQKVSMYSKLLSPKTLHIWLKCKTNVMLKSLFYKFDDKTHQMGASRTFNLIISQYLDKWSKLCCVENTEPLRTIVHILCLGQIFTHRGIEWCWAEYLRTLKIKLLNYQYQILQKSHVSGVLSWALLFSCCMI